MAQYSHSVLVPSHRGAYGLARIGTELDAKGDDMNTAKATLTSLALIALAATPALADGSKPDEATWQLVRVNVEQGDSANPVTYRCSFTPGRAELETDVGGISTVERLSLATDAQAIQGLVLAAQGLPRADHTNATSYTNWWAFPTAGGTPKLVRTSITYKDGTGLVQDDPTAAGKTLSVWMGANCPRRFGQ
jgi:hypothetical protein